MIGVLGHDSALLRLYWAGDNLGKWGEFCYESADRNEMTGVLGHDSALLTLYWALDNLG